MNYATHITREKAREIIAMDPQSPPHCNSTIVHAPGDCVFCDETPGWQDQCDPDDYDPVWATQAWGGNAAVADAEPQVLIWEDA